MQRSHRAEAIRLTLATADCLGRTMAETGFFDTTKCTPDAVETRFEFEIRPAEKAAADHYTITATPVDKNDRCGSLSLDHTGARGAGRPGADISKCWGGR